MRRRLIIASVIFFTALTVGLGGDLLFSGIFLPVDEIATINSSVGDVIEPEPAWMRDPMINQMLPLYIDYDCSVRNGKLIEARFTLTNVSSEPVFFSLEKRSGKLPSLLSNAFPWSKDVLSRIESDHLSPGASTRLYVPVPDEAEYFHLSFGVSSGRPDRIRTVYWNLYSASTAPTCTELF